MKSVKEVRRVRFPPPAVGGVTLPRMTTMSEDEEQVSEELEAAKDHVEGLEKMLTKEHNERMDVLASVLYELFGDIEDVSDCTDILAAIIISVVPDYEVDRLIFLLGMNIWG